MTMQPPSRPRLNPEGQRLAGSGPIPQRGNSPWARGPRPRLSLRRRPGPGEARLDPPQRLQPGLRAWVRSKERRPDPAPPPLTPATQQARPSAARKGGMPPGASGAQPADRRRSSRRAGLGRPSLGAPRWALKRRWSRRRAGPERRRRGRSLRALEPAHRRPAPRRPQPPRLRRPLNSHRDRPPGTAAIRKQGRAQRERASPGRPAPRLSFGWEWRQGRPPEAQTTTRPQPSSRRRGRKPWPWRRLEPQPRCRLR